MTPTRRSLLCAGLGLTGALASRADAMASSDPADACDRPPASGELSCAADVRDAAAHDFGRILHRHPRAVFRPGSIADIAGLMRWAGEQGLKVAARGQGHSTYGRSMAEGGIVVDMRALEAVHAVEQDRIVVDAGATWKSVLEATLAQGLTPPVLTAYLDLSVGGTIAVGGIGGSSSRHGMQTDHVLALDVVTGDGVRRTCSARENPDLFDAMRAGLGQCGIIVRATLRLMRAPTRVRRYQLYYADFASLSADQRRALADQRFDQLQGAILPDAAGGWRYQLDGARFYDGDAAPDDGVLLAGMSDLRNAAMIADLAWRDDAHAFAKFESLLRSNGQWSNPQPWLFTFLRGSNAEQIAAEILDGLTVANIGPFGRITYYPLLTGAFRTPLVRLPDEGIAFALNLVRIPATDDAASVARLVAQNRALHDRIREAGGVQYPVGALALSVGDWKRHFGSKWQFIHDAKRRYDAGSLLTPGYDVV